MPNKNKSFLSFLEDLSNEIEMENERNKQNKKKERTKNQPLRQNVKRNPSIIDFINDFVEKVDVDFGNISMDSSEKPDFEAQRSLKAELKNKHADKLKKSSHLQGEIDNIAKKSLEEIHKDKTGQGSIKDYTFEGDNEALKRLKSAEKKAKIDEQKEELAKAKNRKRLKDAIIMAEILGPPVSKRR